jgi:hypothetical protein
LRASQIRVSASASGGGSYAEINFEDRDANYIRYFSTTIYAAIPSTVGGGRPQSVIFLLEESLLL